MSTCEKTRRIGITLGDPNGIGPEIVLKALGEFRKSGEEGVELLPIGDPELIQATARRFELPLVPCFRGEEAAPFPVPEFGKVTASAGAASAAWVEQGITACLSGELDALVTGPISKEAWKLAGKEYPGHTELLAERCGTKRFGMLLEGGGLRVMLATRHLPLRRVAEQLTEHDIRLAVELLVEGLPLLGVSSPRIAVCGLNPHAGDGGAIGTEERDWIAPLLRRMEDEGLPVSGPHPADTVFHQAVRLGQFDAVVALYHDQGLAPLKLWAFDEGVNLTFGLPLVRTSPDHGTAFGIAGRGVARPDSLLAAIRRALQLSTQPLPWTRALSA